MFGARRSGDASEELCTISTELVSSSPRPPHLLSYYGCLPNRGKKNVHSQAVGTGARSIRYLASYVFRTAISDSRIIEIEQGHVRFRYADTKTGTAKTMRLSAFEFIRRFLQHVLPTGFMKIRYYGFLHPCSKIPLDLAIALLEAWSGVRAARDRTETQHGGQPFCPHCNGLVRLLHFIPPRTFVNSGFT